MAPGARLIPLGRADHDFAERQGHGAEKFLGTGQEPFRQSRPLPLRLKLPRRGYGEAPAVELGRSRVCAAVREE